MVLALVSSHFVRESQAAPPLISLPYRITDTIPASGTAQGATFFTDQFVVDYHGETIMLSRFHDGLGQTAVDDAIEIIVTRPNGMNTVFNHDYSLGCAGQIFPHVPFDITHLFGTGESVVSVRLYDICGVVVNSTQLYLGVPGSPPLVEVPTGFSVEDFATGLGNPVGIAVAPPEFGSYGGNLFVANRNAFADPTGDWIARIDATGGVSPFLTTDLYDPGNIAFGPGGGFGYDLYIGNNGAPGFQPNSNVLKVQANGTSSVLAVLALPEISSTNPSGGLAFDTSGSYGNDLFVGNTGGRAAIIQVTEVGDLAPFFFFDSPQTSTGPVALVFGNGNGFQQH